VATRFARDDRHRLGIGQEGPDEKPAQGLINQGLMHAEETKGDRRGIRRRSPRPLG